MNIEFKEFSQLPVELQNEAIREGEILLQAQLGIAADADRRALTWSGFVLAGATALLSAGFATLDAQPFNYDITIGAFLAGAALLLSAGLSILTVNPREFCLPGSRPGLWLPSRWDCVGTDSEKLQAARLDQAKHLDKFIRSNADTAKGNAGYVRFSIGLAYFTIFASSIVLLLKLVL